jgi:hypothetical protein
MLQNALYCICKDKRESYKEKDKEPEMPTTSTLSLTSPLCACNCGNYVTPIHEFLQGHQTIHRSNLLVAARNGSDAAKAELAARGWRESYAGLRGPKQVSSRRFGVEIEFFGCSADVVVAKLTEAGINVVSEGYNHATCDYWKLIHDGSVAGEGHELVSPILSGEAGLTDLSTVMNVLEKIGKVDKTCGMHVHFDANDLSVDSLKYAVNFYVANQDYFDAMVSLSRRNNQYCMNSSDYDLEAMNAATTIQEFTQVAQRTNRYRKININSYAKYGTIEIRQHQGTLNARKACEWVKMGCALFDRSKTAGRAARRYPNPSQFFHSLKISESYWQGRVNALAA